MSVDMRGRQLQGGKYELREPIAQGGMATVWAAHMRALDVTVAVKVLAPRLADDPIFRERFQAEAQRLARLYHPSIIEVHDFDEEDDILYIAMRFVPGGTLSSYIDHVGGPLDLNLATRLIGQVASALQSAHDRGIVHQDVKPANILLGGADWPLLSDFGIASMSAQTAYARVISGTPPYMPPEQWQGSMLDGRTDQYALAVVFYELVTGRLPFVAETMADYRALHIEQPPPRPRELNPGIPGPVEEVMLRGLAKSPEQRYPRIADFAAALLEAVERSRGMRLETKQAVVDLVPALLAVIGLSVITPIVAGVANPYLPVVGQLTLNWPILLVMTVLEAILLLGVRWHLVGLLGRLLNVTIDALDRFTRLYVRLGTDVEGPLRVQRWRSAIVGSAEHIVNISYVFLLYQLGGLALINTLAGAIDPAQQPLISTAITALVLLLAGANLVAIWRASGAVLGTVGLALCWAFIGAMPVVDRPGWGGLSLQWSAKLIIGLAVVAALLSVRKSVQRFVQQVIQPLVQRPLGQLPSGLTDRVSGRVRDLDRAASGLIDVVYLVVCYPILAPPIRNLLKPVVDEKLTAILITVAVVVLAAVLVNALRQSNGVALAIVGLLLCTPLILELPLFEGDSGVGSSIQWIARFLIGLGILGLLLSVRGRARQAGRALLVPFFDRQISAFLAPKTEQEAEDRIGLLGRAADSLVDTLYLLTAYVVIVAPVVGALDGTSLSWVTGVVYAAFLAALAWLVYTFVRRIRPSVEAVKTLLA